MEALLVIVIVKDQQLKVYHDNSLSYTVDVL